MVIKEIYILKSLAPNSLLCKLDAFIVIKGYFKREKLTNACKKENTLVMYSKNSISARNHVLDI